uniref:hypothetical protein n=1 Tax=Acetatifactor sp. TaxID=1872090 RepID=UPI0040575CA9
MEHLFQKMDEAYIQKHFPNGLIFEKVSKKIKTSGIVLVIFILAPIFLGSLYGMIWSARRALEWMAEGHDDMGIAIGICVFFAVITLIFLILIIVTLKGSNKKQGDYIASSAKQSKLPESEIRCFEQQAVASDCYILKLTAGLDRVLSNNTNQDGLLTRDYIYLADPAQTVIRIKDLKVCCFEEYTYYVNNKKVKNLAIRLIASNGVTVSSDTTQKAGLALMELLGERNPEIDTLDGKVLQEGAYMEYYKKVVNS